MKLIDVNVSIGNWPFQSFHASGTKNLLRHLQPFGISSALVSDVECVFLSDPHEKNVESIKKFANSNYFIYVPVLNLRLANFIDEFHFLVGAGAKAIKIIPSYHYYDILSERTLCFLNSCRENHIVPIIQIRFEDERSHHPLMRVPPVDIGSIIKLARIFQDINMVCLCPYYYEAIELCKKTRNVFVDISFVERFNTISSLLKRVDVHRILFGSHTPFLYTEASVMKIKFAEISRKDREMIMFENAARLFTLKECQDEI